MKGYELIKALQNKEIPKGTKIYIKGETTQYRFYTIVGKYRQLHIWREEEEKDVLLERVVDTEDLINSNFIIYKKENTTDRIEEFKTYYTMRQMDRQFKDKINEVIREVNKLIKEKEKE